MMTKAIVTTGHKVKDASVKLAMETAERLGLSFVRRGNASLEELKERQAADFVLVAKKGGLRLETPEGELFFHPNMAQLRVKNLRLGKPDHMVEAMGLQPGMRVLDCTLGLGADAIVASFAVGDGGSVTGLEASPLIAAVVGYGLAHFVAENYPIQEAMRRIQTVQTDYLAYLKAQPDASVDVVYFDPMFRHPLRESVQLAPLRTSADHRPVSLGAMEEAKRVARQRVVLKENSRSLEFARLGFAKIAGGKYSHVHYGIWEKNE